jgi:hypothetical protein
MSERHGLLFEKICPNFSRSNNLSAINRRTFLNARLAISKPSSKDILDTYVKAEYPTPDICTYICSMFYVFILIRKSKNSDKNNSDKNSLDKNISDKNDSDKNSLDKNNSDKNNSDKIIRTIKREPNANALDSDGNQIKASLR